MFKITYFNTLDSTQTYLVGKIMTGNNSMDCHEIAVVANNQTNGKGTKANQWVSMGGNLHVSISLKLKEFLPDFRYNNFIGIYFAYVLTQVLSSMLDDKNITIKWPNDVLINGAKISGILVNICTNPITKEEYAVVGIGCNITHSPKTASNETTYLLSHTDKDISINKILEEIYNVYKYSSNILLEKDLKSISNKLQKFLYKKGDIVTLSYKEELLPVKIIEVNIEGRLVVKYNKEKIIISNSQLIRY